MAKNLSHAQKVELNDFREHHGVILQNIKLANKELEEVLAKKEQAELATKELLAQAESAKQMMADFAKEKDLEEKRLAHERELLEHSKSEHLTRVDEFNSSAHLRLSTIATAESESDQKLGVLGASINDLQSKKDALEAELVQLTDSATSLRGNVSQLLNDIADHNGTINSLENQIISLTDEYAKLKESRLAELQELDVKIAQAKDSVEMPLRQLHYEQGVFDRKVRNFDIIKNRFERNFKSVFPNQELNV